MIYRSLRTGIRPCPDLSRDEFLKHAWAWTEKHGGIILEQLKRLGASCDWDRTCFTMDEIRSASVIKVFIDLYNKGLIYKGVRMVNWDPSAKTAVSDEEVVYKEEHSKLYHLRYRIDGTEDEYITIATTRPETILVIVQCAFHAHFDVSLAERQRAGRDGSFRRGAGQQRL